MGLFSNKVDRSELQAGDHIYSYRKLHTYSHHGIYVEADRVIHYNKTKAPKKLWVQGKQCRNCGHQRKKARGVVKTCVDCFLAGHELYRYEYGVSFHHYVMKLPGTCTTAPCEPADIGIRRAVALLQKGFGDYHLLKNNCETFVFYCKTNKRLSGQAYSAMCFGKNAIDLMVKHNMDRLLHDMSIHNPEKHMELKQDIETLITQPFKEIVANLRRLNSKYAGNQDVNQDDQFDEYLETMEKDKETEEVFI